MKRKTFGATDLKVGTISLGCATFGREIDEQASFEIMDHAVENGVTLFDTAEAYGAAEAKQYRREHLGVDDDREVSSEFHSSEKIIGRWLRSRGCRDQIVLCTKVTTRHNVAHVAEALDASLERLQTDYADIYMFHTFDSETPLDERVAAIGEAVRSGKARVAGCSNYDAAQLRDSLDDAKRLGFPPFQVIEPGYSLADRGIENDLLPFCQARGIAVMSYSPLGAGFLAGKYTPDRDALPERSRFHVIPAHADVYFSERNFQLVERLRAMAERTGHSMVRLAMGWVLRNPAIATVLAGARKKEHIDNALAAERMEFPAEWLAEMNAW